MLASSPLAPRPLARGDVVLALFPFTDLTNAKRRPGIIVGTDPVQNDFTLAFVSSQQIASLGAGDFALLPTHPEYTLTGLRLPSKVRAGKLVTLSRSLLTRWLGHLGPALTAELDQALTGALRLNLVPYREEGRRLERGRLADLHTIGGTPALLADLGLAQPQ